MKKALSFQFLIFFCLGLSLSACQKGEEKIQRRSPVTPELEWKTELGCADYKNQIVGGSLVEKSDLRSRSVFQIWSSIETNKGERNEVCTATLIRKDVLLTAAHCISFEKLKKIRVFFNTSYLCSEGMKKSLLYYAKTYIVHEKYKRSEEPSKTAQNYDLALIQLNQDAPGFTQVLHFWDGQLGVLQSNSENKVFLVGYGKTSSKAASDEIPRLRAAQRDIDEIRKISNQSKIEVQKSSINGACQGDSGGPLIVQQHQKYVIAGVASYIEYDWMDRNRQCENSSILYNDVNAYKSWIETNLKKLRP